MTYVDPSKVRPLGRNILLKRHDAHERIGLIFTPEDRIEKNLKCTVLAVGSGQYFSKKGYVPPQCRAGDVVAVRQWRGILLNPHDPSVLFVSEDLVEGIFPQEEPISA